MAPLTKSKAIGQQFRYLRRNLKHIEEQLRNGGNLSMLSNYQYKSLLVIHEVYRQQEIMYREKTHRIPDPSLASANHTERKGGAGQNGAALSSFSIV